MPSDRSNRERIDFVVGSEIRIHDIFSRDDVAPLLRGLVEAGARRAALTDDAGRILWIEGEGPAIDSLPGPVLQDLKGGTRQGRDWRSVPVHHEGEPLGFVYIALADSMAPALPAALISIAAAALDVVRRTTVKRLLTTQAHTSVVHQSYEDLLETNRQLTASREKYRELSRTLQQRVDERTAELNRAHTRLLQKEKMACIGQLAAGVAHEINTPLNYISGNIRALSAYVQDLHTTLEGYSKVVAASPSSRPLAEKLEALDREVDVDHIIKDTGDLVRESLEGTERIGTIVANLKKFSHVDEVGSRMMDINAELDTTLQIVAQAHKDRPAKIIRKYGRLPGCYGHPPLIAQVFMNVLKNALQSCDQGLIVTVETTVEEENVVVSITDNGDGIPEEIRDRIFEPFFTTREVGEGTGIGLSVAYDIVTTHGGRIAVQSEVGRGTTIEITLPAGSPAGRRDEQVEEPLKFNR